MIQVFTDKETREHREKVCKDCPKRDGVRCGVCGCFLIGLKKIAHAKCPLQKWQK